MPPLGHDRFIQKVAVPSYSSMLQIKEPETCPFEYHDDGPGDDPKP